MEASSSVSVKKLLFCNFKASPTSHTPHALINVGYSLKSDLRTSETTTKAGYNHNPTTKPLLNYCSSAGRFLTNIFVENGL